MRFMMMHGLMKQACCWMVGVLILSTASARADLISYYTLDGTAADAEGVQDGVINGGPAVVAGKIGQAFSFNEGVAQGSRTQNITIEDPAGGEHRPEDITLSAWVKTTDDGAWRGVVDKIAFSYGISLSVHDTYALVVPGDGAYYAGVDGFPKSLAAVNDGQWHLITGTFATEDGHVGPATLYVDGILQETETNQYLGNAVTMNITGDIPVSSNYAIDGVIDDVGLWNHVLTDAEARALYTLADNTTLNYGLGNAQDVFDIHNAGPGSSADVAGRTWYYETGLSGGLGELVESGGEYHLQLDESGSGVYAAAGGGPLAGDLNDDGFVGGDDLDIVRSFWGQNVTAGDLLSGDPSGDGFVGGDDLDIVRANWGQGTPPAPNAIPEPSSLLLLVCALSSLAFRFTRKSM